MARAINWENGWQKQLSFNLNKANVYHGTSEFISLKLNDCVDADG
jgi:hypothetical protein